MLEAWWTRPFLLGSCSDAFPTVLVARCHLCVVRLAVPLGEDSNCVAASAWRLPSGSDARSYVVKTPVSRAASHLEQRVVIFFPTSLSASVKFGRVCRGIQSREDKGGQELSRYRIDGMRP